MNLMTGPRMNAVLGALASATFPRTAADIAAELEWDELVAMRALIDCEARGLVQNRYPGDRWARVA